MKFPGTRILSFCFCLAVVSCAEAEILKNASFQDCVVYLWRNGIRVNFIETPVSSKSEGVTVREKMDSLKQEIASLPEDDPSIAKLKTDLEQWSSWFGADGEKAQNILGYKSPRKDVEIDVFGGSASLRILTEAFPEYEEVKGGASLVIVPRSSSLLSKKVSFAVRELPPFEAVKEANSLLRKEFNAEISLGAGGYAQRVQIMEVFNPSKRITLDLRDVTIVDLLSHFAQALGPDIVWSLRTVDDRSVIMFEPPPPRRAAE